MPPALRTPAAAHIVPLALFMVLNFVPGWFKIENSELPWHVRQPELWVYPLQTLLCAVVLVIYRPYYRFGPWNGLGWAVLLGALGIAAWVAPSLLREWLVDRGHEAPDWWEWLGLADRAKGFDPTIVQESPSGYALTLAMRFARMTLVVPLVEELFWRGYLMRMLVDPDRDFQKNAFGTHRWSIYWIVTALVVAAHGKVDYLGAWIWGSLVYLLAVRTRSLGACVVMHAVGNLLLGLYVCQTRQWGFW